MSQFQVFQAGFQFSFTVVLCLVWGWRQGQRLVDYVDKQWSPAKLASLLLRTPLQETFTILRPNLAGRSLFRELTSWNATLTALLDGTSPGYVLADDSVTPSVAFARTAEYAGAATSAE